MERNNPRQEESDLDKNKNNITNKEGPIEDKKDGVEVIFNSGTLDNNIVVVNDEEFKIEEESNEKIKNSEMEFKTINLRVSNDPRPENKIDYNDLLYKDVLFFFVNTYSGGREGLALVNMGV